MWILNIAVSFVNDDLTKNVMIHKKYQIALFADDTMITDSSLEHL